MRRVLDEVRRPSTGAGEALRNALATVEGTARGVATTARAGVPRAAIDETLYAFYDLDILPPTYDIASFLALAELERRRCGARSIHVVIVPAREGRLRSACDNPVSPEASRMRVTGIMLPTLRLAVGCGGQTVCATREEAALWRFGFARHVFPAGYSPSFPRSPDFAAVRAPDLAGPDLFPLLRAQPHERAIVQAYLSARIGDRVPVVISLREYDFMPARNSRIEQWLRFADRLDRSRFAPVFVRDTERALEPPSGGFEHHLVCEAASWNVGIRMALYELAYLNLATMHGAMELCWFNEACRYLAFMPVGTSPQTTVEFLTERGFVIGKSLPFARPGQALVWSPDLLADIERAFDDMVGVLDGSPRPAAGASERRHLPIRAST